jgi:hypothetical protein
MKSYLAHPGLLLAVVVFMSGAAFAQQVKIEYDRSVDFSRYRKYDWKEHPFLKSHPESEQFTVGVQLVQSNTNQILMKRGYQPVDVDPEFHITQFITARMRQETYTVPAPDMYPSAYMWPGSWYSWSSAWFQSWDTYIEDYVQGILLLDIVDAKTNKLLWRAACKAKIDDMRERHEEIENAVKQALKPFPPRFKPR